MPFCANCGAQYDEGVKFCPACGSATGAAQEQPKQEYEAPKQEYQAPNYQQAASPAAEPVAVDNKTMAILAVVFPVLFFLPLVAGDKTEFGKFWANQALLLFLLGIVASITAAIFVGIVIGIAEFVFWIMCLIAVCNGQMKPMPLIGNITIIK